MGVVVAPLAPEQASYSGVLLSVGILGVVAVSPSCSVRRLYHGRVRRTAPWDCGDPWQTPRMQDTAEGFGQPIRHIFGTAFRMERELPVARWTRAPRYRVQIEDRIWRALYLPLGRGVQRLADAVAVSPGRAALHLSALRFLTLIALLVFVL